MLRISKVYKCGKKLHTTHKNTLEVKEKKRRQISNQKQIYWKKTTTKKNSSLGFYLLPGSKPLYVCIRCKSTMRHCQLPTASEELRKQTVQNGKNERPHRFWTLSCEDISVYGRMEILAQFFFMQGISEFALIQKFGSCYDF